MILKFCKKINDNLDRIDVDEKFRKHLCIKSSRYIILCIWVMLMLFLLSPIYICFGERSGDCALSIYLPSLYINFPFSIIGLLLDLLIDYLMSIINHQFYVSIHYDTYVHPILYWLIMLMSGYIQWFVLFPIILSKIRS